MGEPERNRQNGKRMKRRCVRNGEPGKKKSESVGGKRRKIAKKNAGGSRRAEIKKKRSAVQEQGRIGGGNTWQ